MFTASSAAVVTPSAVARILLIICCGQLIVIVGNTVEAKELEETQIRKLRTAAIRGYNIYKPYPGKWWPASQCLNTRNGYPVVSLEACLEDCTSTDGCTAVHYIDNYFGETLCSWKKCSIPAPEPSGMDPDVTGYAIEQEFKVHQPGKYWNASQCPTVGASQNVSLEVCAINCISLDSCTAFTYNNSASGDCQMVNCPIPAPEPVGDTSLTITGRSVIPLDCSFNGHHYNHSKYITDQPVCAQLQCDGRTGRFIFDGYADACSSCMAYWDPHILTYDQRSFSYQKCGKFSLSQNNITNPNYAVYATFKGCETEESEPTCVHTAYLIDYEDTITVAYESGALKIQVNGNDVDPISGVPSVLKVGQNIYPVLAWTSTYDNGGITKCVNLQGPNGFMIRYCGDSYNYANTVVVLANPAIVLDGLFGLCGNANDNVTDDFTTSDGTPIPERQQHSITRWQASPYDGNGSCPYNIMRVNSNSQNRCELDPSVQERFFNQCRDAVRKGFSQEEINLVNILIDDCVYDLCNVINATKWMETIQATVQIRADMKNNTKESLIITKPPTKPTTQVTTKPTTHSPAEDKCEGNEGWRGKCFGNQNDLSNYTNCDSLIKNSPGCADGNTCCVDCGLLTDLCENKWDGSMARGSPCPKCERKMGELRPGSGCTCCKTCRRKQRCKNDKGTCISDEDPIRNRDWCRARGGIIREKLCKGDGCHCCIWDRK